MSVFKDFGNKVLLFSPKQDSHTGFVNN